MDAVLSFLALVGTFAGAIVLPVTGLVQAVKATFPAMPTRFAPAIALFVGVVLGLVIAYATETTLMVGGLGGVLAGLGSVGLYSLGKSGEQAVVPHG